MSAPALWTAADAAAATGGRAVGDWACTGIASDSRKVAPGDLFVALAGPRFDGHDFVAAALAAGAAAAMVSRVPADAAGDAPLLIVDDVLAALAALAAAARARSRARVIAVTGSVGKTSTKEALRHALAAQATAFASPASFNNQWGVPLALAALPADAAYGVFELGMNHAGEIAPLARLVRPQVAVITAIEPVHLEFFESLAAIADAKAEVFEGMDGAGTAVLNADDAFADRLIAAARARRVGRVVTFGTRCGADVRLIDAALDAEGSAVVAEVAGASVAYRLGAPGRHWVSLSLAALAAVHAAGADVAAAAASLAEVRPLAGRGARHRVALDGGAFTVIDESYNANPASMRAAIAALGATPPGPGGRRIAVLGEMRELGAAAPELHAELAAPVIAAGVELTFTVGEGMGHLRDALPQALRGGHAGRAEDIAAPVAAAVRAGDVVMVKGSRGGGAVPAMTVIVDALLARAGDAAPRAAGNG